MKWHEIQMSGKFEKLIQKKYEQAKYEKNSIVQIFLPENIDIFIIFGVMIPRSYFSISFFEIPSNLV